MKALIIGGTKGFGKEILEQLVTKGYDPITVSRANTGYRNYPHHSCDVGDLKSWSKVLGKIKMENKNLDFLACVVGYASAKFFKDLSIKDWNQSFSMNVTYIALAFQELEDLLKNSKKPRGFTIGSQWSYKTGNDKLVPYTTAKHALRSLTEDFALQNPWIKVNHYCAPTMETPGYWEVRQSFQDIGEEKVIKEFTPEGAADAKIIAKSIINDIHKTTVSGSSIIIDPGGSLKVL